VSRFVRVGEATISLREAGSTLRDRVRVAVDVNPRQQNRGRELLGEAQNIMRFYAGVMGDAPYAAATIALVEDELPGGHSPGYFAVVNHPLPYSRFVWRNDPAAFQGFPEFFVAHELAHQWWGQAVGWRNYHEQWLSEGFAQYFAALYAREARGETVFVQMLRQFRRWSLAEADEGPITLGYRLGHIKGDSRVFRALVYNKGAAVLHMLRRTVGDDIFFRALSVSTWSSGFGRQAPRISASSSKPKPGDRSRGSSTSGFTAPTFLDSVCHFGRRRSRECSPRGGAGRAVDLPVTVTVLYTDGRSQDVVVQLDDQRLEQANSSGWRGEAGADQS
jgi:hypothetical protein